MGVTDKVNCGHGVKYFVSHGLINVCVNVFETLSCKNSSFVFNIMISSEQLQYTGPLWSTSFTCVGMF